MYRSFRVRDFRCLSDVTIHDPGLVNLVSGKNNVGKSSLLEALFLHAGGRNPYLALKVNSFRGMGEFAIQLAPWGESPFLWIFRDLDTNHPIVLDGEDDRRGAVKVSLRLNRGEPLLPISAAEKGTTGGFWREDRGNGSVGEETDGMPVFELRYESRDTAPESYHVVLSSDGLQIVAKTPLSADFPAYFLAARTRIQESQEAKLFSALKKKRKEGRILSVLQLLEPGLQDIQLLEAQGRVLLHGILKDTEPMPLLLMGDGMGRLAALALHVANAEGGIVLVDELENGLHHTVLLKVWEALGVLAHEFKTQVFATTHSLECVEAARQAFSNGNGAPDDFVFYRLDRRGGDVRAVRYGCDELAEALDAGFEVR